MGRYDRDWKYDRQPTVRQIDLPGIQQMLRVFDKMVFNSDGEFCFVAESDLPLLGAVSISYWQNGDHLLVKRDSDDETLLSLEHPSSAALTTDKTTLVHYVRQHIKAAVAAEGETSEPN